MIRVLQLGLVALVSLVGSTAHAADGTLIVANRAGSVSLFDLTTEVEVARLPIGPIIPHEVSVSPDGRWALTSEYGPNDRRGRRVIIIDIVGARVAGYIELGPNSRPHDMRILPDNRRAVITMEDSDQIAVVDIVTQSLLRTYPTGAREGHLVRLSPAGDRAYVTSRGENGSLSVIYLDGDREPTVIETGAGAEGIAVTHDGREIWVLNRRDASVSIVDARMLQVTEVLTSIPFPSRAAAAADGRMAIVNGLTGETTNGRLRIYDAASRQLLHDLAVPGDAPNERGRGVAFNTVGDVLFLSTQEAAAILLYDTGDFTAPHLLTTGHDAPDGLAWSPLRVGVFED